MKKGIHIMNPKKQNKVYVNVLLFILYEFMYNARNTKWFAYNHQNQVNLLLLILTNSGRNP